VERTPLISSASVDKNVLSLRDRRRIGQLQRKIERAEKAVLAAEEEHKRLLQERAVKEFANFWLDKKIKFLEGSIRTRNAHIRAWKREIDEILGGFY
jgi:hypothetical protein